MANDWLPRPRAAQIELAKQWKPHVTAQKTAWSIPNTEVTRLGNAIELVDECQADVERNPSPGNRAALREAEEDLAQRRKGTEYRSVSQTNLLV